jgi:putative transcriptional regulator
MPKINSTCVELVGKLLVAMPHVKTSPFTQTLIYIYEHDSYGSRGLIVNRISPKLHLEDLLAHLGVVARHPMKNPYIYHGGSTDLDRGFVLHTGDYLTDGSLLIGDNFALTKTVEIIKTIISQSFPQHYWITMGCTYWPQGQLERDLQENYWLCIEPTIELVFSMDLETKWRRAFSSLGTIPAQFTTFCGHT